MAELITMLALSPTMEEGTLVEWLKSEGDSVAEGDLIAEIETDKATMEMESFFDGTILKLLVEKGDAVPVGAPLAIVGEPGEDYSDVFSSSPAPSAPVVSAPIADIGEPILTPSAPQASAVQGTTGRIIASPVAKKMAEEKGISLSSVQGSGPKGRIIKRDIENYSPLAPPGTPVFAEGGEGEKIPMSQMRKTIAKRLTQVWVETPQFFLTRSVDMGAAMTQRKIINTQLAEAGVDAKVSVNDLIIKASAVALDRYPDMNVSYRGDHILKFDAVHIGVAVAIEDGLITPTIKNAHLKPISKIASEIKEMVGRAKNKKLRPDEYTGGTFSVSNLGMFGIEEFTAIINPPQAGILACGAVAKVPVVDENGELSVGTRMKITLTCDHRAVDGAVGARFLQELVRLLENPILMLV